jgi:protocatechuate 4,5-dioxygenase alpha subunit
LEDEAMAEGATYRDTELPDTVVFTGARSRQGYRLNKFAISLTDDDNRKKFRADERAYMATFGMSQHEIDSVVRRDWSSLVAAGGNIYQLIKIGGAVGQNQLQIGAQMRGESLEQFMKTRPGPNRNAVQRSK